MALQLRLMTADEYPGWFDYMVEGYAQEISRNFDTPIEQVRVQAREQTLGLLPKGIDTENHRVWMVVTDAGETVGHLWVAINTERDDVFIFSIEIDEAQRGKGYAQQTLQLLDDEVRQLGLGRITLNVFGDNAVARHVYDKHGFRITNMTMQKRFDKSAAAHD